MSTSNYFCAATLNKARGPIMVQGNEESIQIARNITILIVDDEEVFRGDLCKILTESGYRAIPAENGKRALTKFKRVKPDLIITDLRMPEMDGLEFLFAVRKKDPLIPVIMMTAYGEVDSYLTSMNLGVSAYLHKPFSLIAVFS